MLSTDRCRVPPGSTVDLSLHDPRAKDAFDGDNKEGRKVLPDLNTRLAELQRRLWGEAKRKLLVVLQAMDTGGKDGTIREVFSGANPQGGTCPRIWETH